IANTDRLTKEVGGKAPATWDDLLDPAWKGKLILPDPVKTGGGYIFIATQIFRFNKDEDKAMAYMKTLHGNIADYIGTSPGAIGAPAPGAPTLTSVKLVNYDRQWATDNKTRLLTKWQQTVGRT